MVNSKCQGQKTSRQISSCVRTLWIDLHYNNAYTYNKFDSYEDIICRF